MEWFEWGKGVGAGVETLTEVVLADVIMSTGLQKCYNPERNVENIADNIQQRY